MSPLLTGRLARLKEKLPLSGHQTPEDKLIPADAEFSSELQEAEQLTVAKKNLVPEKYRAIVENVVFNGLLGIAEDKLNDDEFINNLFNKVYEILPTPVRLILSRERCLQYLMSNKGPLLTKLQDYRKTQQPENTAIEPITLAGQEHIPLSLTPPEAR
ncbi:hypothetical protein QLG07_19185 [Erwinia sp. V90_4]|jgi:hypothetical protein|uniref:hypothetical protein n=1 Tax=Erwinia sp. V90_4 TaxID=3044239 RepID=UPI00249DC16A|nr:hypothetical protein [Erwinia sp. V90_4]MDI3441594.1 hypothetical protein [Erwinia sp. V90_4]